METKYLLYGAGGHAKVILNCLSDQGFKVVGLFDDDRNVVSFFDLPIYHEYGPEISGGCKIIVSVGNNPIRKKIAMRIKHAFGVAVHPSAQVSKMAGFGGGTVIFQNSVIQPSVHTGEHCIINTGAIIEHDCILDDYVHVSPNATLCGGVQIAEGAHIGASAVILPGVSIGAWAVVGAGAVVLDNVPDYAVVVGNPARIIKFNVL